MQQFVGQIILAVEAENQDEAREKVEAAAASHPGSTVVYVSDSLGGQFNPVHLLEAQSAFGHIAPPPPGEAAEEEE